MVSASSRWIAGSPTDRAVLTRSLLAGSAGGGREPPAICSSRRFSNSNLTPRSGIERRTDACSRGAARRRVPPRRRRQSAIAGDPFELADGLLELARESSRERAVECVAELPVVPELPVASGSEAGPDLVSHFEVVAQDRAGVEQLVGYRDSQNGFRLVLEVFQIRLLALAPWRLRMLDRVAAGEHELGHLFAELLFDFREHLLATLVLD